MDTVHRIGYSAYERIFRSSDIVRQAACERAVTLRLHCGYTTVTQAACERALEQSNARAEMAELKGASLAAAIESLRAEHAAATAQASELQARAAQAAQLSEQDTRVALAETASAHAAELAAEQGEMVAALEAARQRMEQA